MIYVLYNIIKGKTMDDEDKHFHFVSTLDEARDIINTHEEYWVSNCGCRENEGCTKSRMDVCLFFDTQMGGTGSDFKKVQRKFVEGIFDEARDKNLVPRPFRYKDDKESIQGICFCCDDCCYYFNDSSAECDKGTYVEQTDIDSCTDCGECVEVCYFDARKMNEGELTIIQENCYGCGVCSNVCPEGSITMVKR